ncbi:MAG: GGDEF domain-containing protein [Leptospirillia bacterium]
MPVFSSSASSLPSPEILPPSFRLKLPTRLVRELVVTPAWVPEDTPLERVYRMFGSDPSLPGLAILRGRCPLGILTKNALVEKFSYRYSHELFGHKPVAEFMEADPPTFEAGATLDSLERCLGEARSHEISESCFLIVEGEEYLGIGTWQGVLKKMASRREEIFFYMSHHDALTGLPNRLAFMRELEGRLLREESGTLIYLDLDGFKEVNDRFGHEEGDALLIFFAERLESFLPPGSLAARLGGDEFAVLLSPEISPGFVETFLEGLKVVLSGPASLGDKPYRISVSLGRVLFPGPGLDMARILRLADTRMYEEKKNRRAASPWFS